MVSTTVGSTVSGARLASRRLPRRETTAYGIVALAVHQAIYAALEPSPKRLESYGDEPGGQE